MHTLQWIAIQAEDDVTEDYDVEEQMEDAFNELRNTLESYLEGEYNGAWYDWMVVGGGRWNENADPYFGSDMSMVIHDTDTIKAKVEECLKYRVAEFNDYRKSFDGASVDLSAKLDSYDGTTQYSFDLYPLNKMIDMLQGEWDFNSKFYDITHYSTNPKFMLDSIASGSVNWYLVPVDFHF
jgi:hypothetical protein